jgi:hypothetical protein
VGEVRYRKGRRRAELARIAGRLYIDEGWSVRRIGRLLDMSYPAARWLLVHDAGVVLRDRSQAATVRRAAPSGRSSAGVPVPRRGTAMVPRTDGTP